MLKLITMFVLIGWAEGECPGQNTGLAPLPPITRDENEAARLPVCEAPYLDPNCTCPSSMFECACHKIGKCISQGCVDMSLVYDGRQSCEDWSDELSDVCPDDKFQCDCFNTTCRRGFGCVRANQRCDGKIDCLDESDEVNCSCPAADKLFECDCFKSKKCRSVSGCISRHFQCDGVNQCGDWSDEVNCTCPADEFECDCFKSKKCSLSFGCLSRLFQCDGFNHCGDWSDEVNCTCSVGEFECWCSEHKNCKPGYSGCISKSQKCDGYDDCGDLSDEVYCSCPKSSFECANQIYSQDIEKNRQNCVDRSLVCDGKPDCRRGSDEKHAACNCSGIFAKCPCDSNTTNCQPTGYRCIPLNWIGDKIEDCFDGSDEVCSYVEYRCGYCWVYVSTCPSEEQARNLINLNFSEQARNLINLNVSEQPRNLINLNVSWECNAVIDNKCASDVNSCLVHKAVCTAAVCSKNIASQVYKTCNEVFFCKNEQLVPKINFCDGEVSRIKSCTDRSDEVRQGFGFKCSGFSKKGICILPQTNVYDSVAQCSDRSDICFLNGQFRCFQCLDRKLIVSSKQVCDGVVDCFDMSDECLCPNQTLCQDIRGDCPMSQMHCNDRSECVDQKGVLCNTSVQCLNQINTKYCLMEKVLEGDNECVANERVFTEDNSDNTSFCVRFMRNVFRYRVGWKNAERLYPMWCDGTSFDGHLYTEAYCPNRFQCFALHEVNIPQHRVCDGKVDCLDGADEVLSLCQHTQYYCKAKDLISINNIYVCDGIVDCDDRSDESRCRCENTRFYCIHEEPLSIPWRLVENGIDDCSDGSDECVNLASDAFADVNEMIANPVYRGIFWVTGALALGGNLFVFVTTTRDLIKTNKDQNLFINTSVFILNLCVSDFLMGVYLLTIIIESTTFSGSYCLHDKLWRSSSLCSGLGALAVISSEASAFTMTAMTTFRLISAFKPFLMRNASVSKTLIAELFCWILAVALATVPLLNSTSEYFVTHVWFPNNFYGTDFVSRKDVSLLARRSSNSTPNSWHEVKRRIKQTFPHDSIKGEFGYYGETSVCMPRFFATTSEFAWEYSTFLITLNFLMFVYMVVAYLLIYKRSNRMKGSRSTDVSSKMQKRITRLILTDFCCWIPICVMGFLSAGGVKMPGDAYVLSACLLLPINSALNPLLYSKALEERLSKMKKWIVSKISSLHASKRRSSHLSVRYNPRAEQEGGRVIEIVE